MSEPYTIVFLYSRRYVPQQILAMASAEVPAGFRLELLEQDAPAERRREKTARADFLLGYPGNPSKQEIAAARRLKLFQVLSAGYKWLNLAAFQQAGIPVANNGRANAPTVAEHTPLLILAVYKKLPLHHASLHQGAGLVSRKPWECASSGPRPWGLLVLAASAVSWPAWRAALRLRFATPIRSGPRSSLSTN